MVGRNTHCAPARRYPCELLGTDVKGSTVPLKVIYQGTESVIDDDANALIGSDASSTVRIVRPGISRRHAVVSHDGAGWKVEDAGSRNGTFEDGKRVQVAIIDRPTTLFLGHPTDGEQVSLVPVVPESDDPVEPEPVPAAADDFDLPDQASRSTAAAVAPTRVQPVAPRSTTTPSPQPAASPSATDIELAQLTAAIRDQISAVKGLTWSVWAMIAVTAALIVLTLFVGILSN